MPPHTTIGSSGVPGREASTDGFQWFVGFGACEESLGGRHDPGRKQVGAGEQPSDLQGPVSQPPPCAGYDDDDDEQWSGAEMRKDGAGPPNPGSRFKQPRGAIGDLCVDGIVDPRRRVQCDQCRRSDKRRPGPRGDLHHSGGIHA